jgi:hypothetical protein
MSGYKRCHEDATSHCIPGQEDFNQSKKSRVTVDSNYLALANILDARLDTLTRRIEHMLTQLNTRLGNLEATVHSLTNTVDAMHVTIYDSMSMVVANTGSLVKTMDTGSPMDTGTPTRHSHASYYA